MEEGIRQPKAQPGSAGGKPRQIEAFHYFQQCRQAKLVAEQIAQARFFREASGSVPFRRQDSPSQRCELSPRRPQAVNLG